MVLPAAKDHSYPLKGEGSYGCLMSVAPCPLLCIVGLRPARIADRLPSKFMARRSQKLWTKPAHVRDHCSATPCNHGCNPDQGQQIFNRFIATPVRASCTD